MGREQRGTATLEMMFAFPIIFLVLICGFMIGYYQFAKTALIWHVFNRSEDLAAHTSVVGVIDSVAGVVDTEPPAGLQHNSNSFSFAVPIPNNAFTFSFACYATPLQIPQFNFGKGSSPAPAQPPGGNMLERLNRLVRSVQAYVDKAGGYLDSAEDIRDDAYLGRELIGQLGSGRTESTRQAARLVTGWAVEQGMGQTCNQPGRQVIVARAVAWAEQTKSYKKAGAAQFK
ncbi:MAG: hypothetical protein JWN15_1498 [Firmicutes bacterium]|nr:hypothetical protein [Bacillota bacterium]